jgi:hypothetical protein
MGLPIIPANKKRSRWFGGCILRSEVIMSQKFGGLAQHYMFQPTRKLLRLQVEMEQEFYVPGCSQIVCVATGFQGILMMHNPKIEESFIIGGTNISTLFHYFFARLPRTIPVIQRAELIVNLESFCQKVLCAIKNQDYEVDKFAEQLGVDMSKWNGNDFDYTPEHN